MVIGGTVVRALVTNPQYQSDEPVNFRTIGPCAVEEVNEFTVNAEPLLVVGSH
jgi:hypothetical protein